MNPLSKKISTSHHIICEEYTTYMGESIPKGYVWDGMSFNKIAFIEKFGSRVDAASLEHDWCYVHEGVFKNKILTRRETDLNLKKTLIQHGVNKSHATYIYFLVRFFGWFWWM